MKMHTVTGASPRDYIELVPESIEEAAAIVFAARSVFLPSDSTLLEITPEIQPFLALRIYVGKDRPAALDPETRDALDRTP